MDNLKKLEETINDIEALRQTISERHSDDSSLLLRLDSVFKRVVNSLNVTTGRPIDAQITSFQAQPLKHILGKEIKIKTSERLKLKPLQVDEVAAFKEKIHQIHDSFLDRKTQELLDSLTETEIRGVAKISKVKNFDKAPVDGQLIKAIKEAIQSNTLEDEDKLKEQDALKNSESKEVFKEAIQSNTLEDEDKLKDIRAEYHQLHPEGKEVPSNKKNDPEWIGNKITEFKAKA